MALPTPLQAFSGVPKNTASADKQTIIDGEKMTGAQALIRALEDLGVQDVFGCSGPAWDLLAKYGLDAATICKTAKEMLGK